MSPTRLNPTPNKAPNNRLNLFEATSRKGGVGQRPQLLWKENLGHLYGVGSPCNFHENMVGVCKDHISQCQELPGKAKPC